MNGNLESEITPKPWFNFGIVYGTVDRHFRSIFDRSTAEKPAPFLR